jgi:glycosyltransferase involved in cell wall biosynthesis
MRWWQLPVNYVYRSTRPLWNTIFETPALKFMRRFGHKGEAGLVSIPIATFDRIETVVSRTIPALLNQSYRNIEIIIVSDGTSDSQLDMLQNVESEKVRVVSLGRRSKYPDDPLHVWFVAGSRARNTGAKHAKGEFLLWTSDDDVFTRKSVEKLVRFLIENPGVDAVGGASQLGGDPGIVNRPSDNTAEIGLGTGAMPAWLHRRSLRVLKWSTQSWRKEWNRPADYDLAERLKRAGATLAAIDDLVVIKPISAEGLHGSRQFIAEEIARRETYRGAID